MLMTEALDGYITEVIEHCVSQREPAEVDHDMVVDGLRRNGAGLADDTALVKKAHKAFRRSKEVAFIDEGEEYRDEVGQRHTAHCELVTPK